MKPAPSPPPALRIGALFRLNPSAPRWPAALRAALSVALPVAAGWAAGDISAGFMATIGAFTALYASGRPYANRALVLACVALSLALVVSLGVWTQHVPPIAVPVIVAIAMTATFLCNSLRTGPPGAYMFALSCAAGSAMPVAHLAVWQVALLVLSGGALSWAVHMAGALIRPRGPERDAVAAAAKAVARFAEAAGTTARDAPRHAAALALHDAWAALVTFQPVRPRPDGTLARLRALTRELHLLFAACVNASGEPADLIATRARDIGASATSPAPAAERADPSHIPLGRPGTTALLRENLRPRSPALFTATRVGIAVAAAGATGAAFGLDRAYWAMAAAVLVLHQGLDWTRTLQRGIERMAGTLVGLCLAGTILALHPAGLALVAAVTILQFAIEMAVTRNYALAVVFITAIALVIGSGGHQDPDTGQLLWARGADTVTGCLIAFGVHVLTAPRGQAISIRREIVRTLATIQTALDRVATGSVTTEPARRARRDLQHGIFSLVASCETEMGGIPRQRDAADRLWPAVVATQRLGYRVLAICWALEEAGAEPATGTLPTQTELTNLAGALTAVIAGARSGTSPVLPSALPDFLRPEVENLAASLVPEAR